MNPKKILKKQPKFEDFYLKFDPQGPGMAAQHATWNIKYSSGIWSIEETPLLSKI